MSSRTDIELLRDYTEQRSEESIAELVQRHVDHVYSAALRMVCDAHLAEDVAQSTFIALARNATALNERTVLSGWLHRTAQNIAAQTVRADVRRRAREQEAASMNEPQPNPSDMSWKRLAPHLDIALSELDDDDRDAVMLRYFERKSAREIGQHLDIGDEAAQKRVSRAVERLRLIFANRGITVGSSGLAGSLSTHLVHTAPIGLASTISTSALTLGGATFPPAATNAIALTTIQKTFLAATLLSVIGAAVFELRRTSALNIEIQTLREQQGLLTEQLEQSDRDREDAVRQFAALRAKNQIAVDELVRLRAEASRSRQQVSTRPATRPEPTAKSDGPNADAEPPEPVQIFVANADARIPAGQTLAIGGWTTDSGKRTLMFVKPSIVNERGEKGDASAKDGHSGSVMLASQIFEVPEAILDKTMSDLDLSVMDKLKTDARATSAHQVLTEDEAKLILQALQTTAGVDLLSAPRVQTGDGVQAVVSITENRTVAGQEYALGPSLDVEPRIAADGSSVNLTVIARLRKASSQ